MTIQYDERLTHLFFRWKGSVWKLVWHDLLLFIILYFILNFIYRFALDADQRETFEDIVLSISPVCDSLAGTVSFLLGFFVSSNVSRWWAQFELLPWPEELMNAVNFCLFEVDEEMNLIRRTIARYFCLTTALAGRGLSEALMERFKDVQDVLKTGLMTESELQLYHASSEENRNFLPLVWVQRLVAHHAKQRNVPPPHSNQIEKEISEISTRFRKLFCYEWVNIPLVYTQCVALATFVYFATCIIGKQFLDPTRTTTSYKGVDYYIPIFTILQLIFYMGWFHVGLKLMKPFGTDDDDFEVNTLLDRHIEVAFEMADAPTKTLPPLIELTPHKLSEFEKKKKGKISSHGAVAPHSHPPPPPMEKSEPLRDETGAPIDPIQANP